VGNPVCVDVGWVERGTGSADPLPNPDRVRRHRVREARSVKGVTVTAVVVRLTDSDIPEVP
jgi:hypothetical protein